VSGDRAVRSGDYGARDHQSTVELSGATLGLLGAGRIGREVGRMCHLGLGMPVLYFDAAVLPRDLVGLEATSVGSVIELFQLADVISIHVPRTPETEGIVNASVLAAARPGAIVVNTARGGVVDENDLAEALRTGRIAGAGIDVFAVEPPAGSPLLDAPNVVTTPHSAGLTDAARQRMATHAAQEVWRVLSGEEPRWPM
jgi:D-3-phosphoglycerate dehydrogenase